MMARVTISRMWLSLAIAAGTGSVAGQDIAGETTRSNALEHVSFAIDVRPILSANCFVCHGRDEEARQADLRLDERDPAVDYGAIVPGEASASLLTERITSDNPELVMPPPDSGPRLTETQIKLLQRWIDQGAPYSKHWSFVPPTRPVPPAVNATDWPTNSIDHFVLRRLEDAGLNPARPASPHVLVRRLFLDLIGLPPSPEEADRFAAAPTLEAYEQLVDALLASPQFGEHWARVWLDLARYADTKGYEKDLPRDMWPYRDWVIRALNADMPFDQFTIEQLAGDLLPDPSRDHLIATAFHRNTMNNDEGGTDDEEFRVAAVKDRIDTTMQAWMGLTAGCAKCHTHKFDPISHEEYYQLFAIFNQTADADTFDDAPVMRFESPEQEQQLKALRERITAIKKDERSGSTGSQPNSVAAAEQDGDAGSGVSLGRDDDAQPQSETDISDIEQQLKDVEDQVVKLPIMRELPEENQRFTRVHLRGNFLDPGDEVLPGVPAAFGQLDADRPPDRLALAKWLMADTNPLTARVAANRIWARLFGIGIVETEGDFGAQGTPPSHAQLLDWLATELRDTCHWSLKKLCKTIVMSSTYRQSSAADDAKLEADPRNRFLSRGPRFRLPAEIVRDQALSASGLLSARMFGPPVMPPQPPGVWRSIYNARKWKTSEGTDRYRRAIYTYWKRTSPYPAMTIFDAESREVCAIRRINTNTPLQALVLMNDPVYLEAAAALAQRIINEGGSTPAGRIARGLRLLVIRPAKDDEIGRLDGLRIATEQKFESRPEAAVEFLAACRAASLTMSDLPPCEFASYVIVASVILNLDETITRN